MSEESKELALCLINENTDEFPYLKRVELGRQTTQRPVMSWVLMTAHYARGYEKEWDGVKFSTADILLAAAELADYYEDHAKECIPMP